MHVHLRKVGLAGGLFLLLLLVAGSAVRQPWIFEKRTAIDVHSGDVRTQIRVLGIECREQVRTSVFSREVRRLGIEIPEERMWTDMYYHSLMGRVFASRYAPALHHSVLIVDLLDRMKASDEDRRIIVERVLRHLRQGQFDEIYEQFGALVKGRGKNGSTLEIEVSDCAAGVSGASFGHGRSLAHRVGGGRVSRSGPGQHAAPRPGSRALRSRARPWPRSRQDIRNLYLKG